MAKTKKILNRIKAAQNIRTVAKAMEMMASTQFKKSHDQTVLARPYTQQLSDLVGDLVARGGLERMDHPLLQGRESQIKRDVMIIITSDRGLCGDYNRAVLKLAMERRGQLVEAGYDVVLHVVGKKAVQRLKSLGLAVEHEYPQLGYPPGYEKAGALADQLMEAFLGGKIGGVEMAYTQFISSGRQGPAISQVLPLSQLESPPPALPVTGEPAPYEFLPSADEILSELLPATVRIRLYQCFLDASVAEQVSRMQAMRAAGDNADEMIHELTVRHNRLRQSQITTELAEIMGGRG